MPPARWKPPRNASRPAGLPATLPRRRWLPPKPGLPAATTTTFEVLQFQRDLATAEASELRARADHIIALASYASATGTTLERVGVSFAE